MATRRVCETCRQAWRVSTRFTSQRIRHRRGLQTAQAGTSRLETTEDWTRMREDRESRTRLIDFMSNYGSTQTRETEWQPFHSLHRPPSPGQMTLSALMAAGAHLGHSTSLLSPNFIPYAYGARAGITIIDLDHTVPLLRRAANLTRAVAARGGTIVFVGTRPNIRGAVKKAAERMGENSFYVGEKWLPGTLTNRLHLFGPSVVRKTKVLPDLMIILNPLANMSAIRECAIEHIPTIGIIDSNVDPRVVMYAIPANDESQRTAELIVGVLSIAGREGVELWLAEKEKEQEDRKAAADAHDRQASREEVYEF